MFRIRYVALFRYLIKKGIYGAIEKSAKKSAVRPNNIEQSRDPYIPLYFTIFEIIALLSHKFRQYSVLIDKASQALFLKWDLQKMTSKCKLAVYGLVSHNSHSEFYSPSPSSPSHLC